MSHPQLQIAEHRCENGLLVLMLEAETAPVVCVSVWFRAGSRHDPSGGSGAAHLLEHMMFKGTPQYPKGEYDRILHALGGINNASTWLDRTNYYAIPAFSMPESHVYDNTRQFLARPGVTWEYMDESTIYLDYQFATFWNNEGTLNTHRVFAGIEHKLFEGLFARGGTTVDMCQQAYAWTGGVGFYPTSWVSLDLAYQYDMFPELAREFGRGQTLNVSLSFTF